MIREKIDLDAIIDVYYTCKGALWGMKKFYIVDVKTVGINGIKKGKRLYILKKNAVNFYKICKVLKCEVDFYTMKSLGTDCYFED